MRIDSAPGWLGIAGLLLSLALSAAVIAADSEQTKLPATDLPPQQPNAPLGKPTDPKPAPQATFEPSEQIKADSSVSFPVDI